MSRLTLEERILKADGKPYKPVEAKLERLAIIGQLAGVKARVDPLINNRQIIVVSLKYGERYTDRSFDIKHGWADVAQKLKHYVWYESQNPKTECFAQGFAMAYFIMKQMDWSDGKI